MSLLKGSVNPLNVIGQRKLSYVPQHFGTMRLITTESEQIDKWIYNNLNSRYCIITKPGLDNDRKIIDMCEIGVEDSKELTMLSLACPYLHKK